MSLETKIYQKENSGSIGKILRESLADIWNSRFLSRQLAERDIKAQYRQSYFGLIWAFVTPLLTAAAWIFLNISGTIKISETGLPYPVYVFSGTLIWSILIESINSPSQSTNSARGILSKINFPKEALVISGIYKLLFNSAIKILLLVVIVFLFGIGFHWSLLLFPFAIIGALIFGTTLGLFLTPIGMLYKDVAKFVSMGLRFLMFITPVLYTIPDTGIMRTLMELNPLTSLVITSRDMITGNTPDFLFTYLGVTLLSVPLFLIALIAYRISIPIIVERNA
ncbi:MAG: ABC transporter permease [Christiangramia sp.]|uniref:ABC transporter permease n=1 Tax=Christiangramia sp. TaxID=1931228 RepID=UPI003242DD32